MKVCTFAPALTDMWALLVELLPLFLLEKGVRVW